MLPKTQERLIFQYALLHTSKHYLKKPIGINVTRFVNDDEIAFYCWSQRLAQKRFKDGYDIYNRIEDHASCLTKDVVNGLNTSLYKTDY